MMHCSFTILGPPRTKKTSNRIVRSGPVTKILPSQAYEIWFRLAMQQAPIIVNALRRDGIRLPITGPVCVSAVFYKEQDKGDLTGYMQALGDYLQEPRQRNGKTVRNGAGIIRDDSQITLWDGTRAWIDKHAPRIEVSLWFDDVNATFAQKREAVNG